MVTIKKIQGKTTPCLLLDRKLIPMHVSHVALQTALLRERFLTQLTSELGSHAALVLQMAEQVPLVLVALHAFGAHVSVEFYKRKGR